MSTCRDKLNGVSKYKPKCLFFDNQLWGIDQLAEYLGVPVRTIRDWVLKRKIPFIKVGRLIRFEKSDIEDWLKNARFQCL